MSDFTNLTNNDIWLQAFFAALGGLCADPHEIKGVKTAADIADEAVNVVRDRALEAEDAIEPPIPRKITAEKSAVELTNEFMVECEKVFTRYGAGLPLKATLSCRIVRLLRLVGVE